MLNINPSFSTRYARKVIRKLSMEQLPQGGLTQTEPENPSPQRLSLARRVTPMKLPRRMGAKRAAARTALPVMGVEILATSMNDA